ncbi:hypothetical protein BDR07DRAFT_1425505 [Suillus spraguei]|nr:hypothetical protein BDR07DRAFT_1425505 [Suillus spraguei]
MCTPIYEVACDKSHSGGDILPWVALLGWSVERTSQKGWCQPSIEEKLRVSWVCTQDHYVPSTIELLYLTASCAPPIRHSNVYGIDIPSRTELIAYDGNTEEITEAI